MRMTNVIPLGCSLLLPVDAVNCVQHENRRHEHGTPTILQNGAVRCMVRVFKQKFTLKDAIGSHAYSFEANTRVTNGIPLRSPLRSPVGTVNCVQTLKASARVPLVIRMPPGSASHNLAFVKQPTSHLDLFPTIMDLAQVPAAHRPTVLQGESLALVRCPFLDSTSHARMPLCSTPLLRLKLLQACDQCHSSQVFTPLTGRCCKVPPSTTNQHEGEGAGCAR
jgi:hypothetical protein